jgi:hypothetical protein
MIAAGLVVVIVVGSHLAALLTRIGAALEGSGVWRSS